MGPINFRLDSSELSGIRGDRFLGDFTGDDGLGDNDGGFYSLSASVSSKLFSFLSDTFLVGNGLTPKTALCGATVRRTFM